MTVERGMTISETADILRMSRRTLQEIIKRHPYYYPVGRWKMFTSSDIEKIRTGLRQEAETERLVVERKIKATYQHHSERAVFDKLRKLTSPTKKKER